VAPAIVKGINLKQYAGWYRDIRNNYMAKINISGDTLRKDGSVAAIGDGVFMDNDSAVIRFSAGGMQWTTADNETGFCKGARHNAKRRYLQIVCRYLVFKRNRKQFSIDRKERAVDAGAKLPA